MAVMVGEGREGHVERVRARRWYLGELAATADIEIVERRLRLVASHRAKWWLGRGRPWEVLQL